LEYYNLFSLASQNKKKELANYEFFNCSKYCDMLKHTELGEKVQKLGREAKTSFDRLEDEVGDRMRRIRMNDKVTRMSDAVRRMKDKIKLVYREKASKVKDKIGGLVEDATSSSHGIRGKFKAKVLKWKQRVKEFYLERRVGPASSYHCIGHQMRNFVLSSVLLQHVAFSVLLWRHWDKCNTAQIGNVGLLGTVAVYWILALTSMLARGVTMLPQWLLYTCMSLVLVHMQPFQIVAFDFLLLLVTISLATISVFDIYHRLYQESLIHERAVLQDHLFMALQVTLLFLHLNAAPLVTALTALAAIFTWRDFVSFFQLQPGQSIFSQAKQLVYNQVHLWIGFAFANTCWLTLVRLMAEIPFSLLHNHLNKHNSTLPELAFLAAEMTLIQCCIVIKYKIRYSEQPTSQENSNAQNHQNIPNNQNLQNLHNQVQNQIPPPPPLPPHWAHVAQPQPLLAHVAVPHDDVANSSENSDSSSLSLLHPTVYWHYVWILSVVCDFLMGLLDRIGYDGISQSLSLVLPIIVLVAVLPVQLHYWNNKWNYDLPMCSGQSVPHEH
jgi:hypothetical protein